MGGGGGRGKIPPPGKSLMPQKINLATIAKIVNNKFNT
jgi:hypothetical protein